MRDAAMERLSKIISDPSSNGNKRKGVSSHNLFTMHLRPEEGWFSLCLVVAVIYTTILCVQAVGWVHSIEILSFTTLLGLIIGMFTVKQRSISPVLLHIATIICGLLISCWQTTSAYYNGNFATFVQGFSRWFAISMNGGMGDDDAIFLFFILFLGFVLAYTGIWLVYRARAPWLMIMANAIVLLINLNYAPSGYILFLVLFLMASLLLVLRFNLYESIRRWQQLGLRYADDLAWDVMQAGALISIGILVISWLLPASYTNAVASQVWKTNANPLVQVLSVWNRVIALDQGENASNHGNFQDKLILAGNPNLNDDVVLTYQTNTSDNPYLALVSYDKYQNGQWSMSQSNITDTTIPANYALPTSADLTHAVTQKITIVNPPGEQYPYILGASSIIQASLSTHLLTNDTGTVAWLGQNGPVGAGTTYTVISALSSADEDTLRAIPLPQSAPTYSVNPDYPNALPAVNAYDPAILSSYSSVPNDIKALIAPLAQRIVADSHAQTMYDMSRSLETYLRTHYKYDVHIRPPVGQDPTTWFLFNSKAGFCNYFASSMVLMARALNIPARVVVGYSSGKLDAVQHQQVVHGSDAHAWVQIYFAGYGWIDFEPSAGYSTFTRPVPQQYPASTTTGSSKTAIKQLLTGQDRARKNDSPAGSSGNTSTNSADAQLQARQHLLFALGSFVLLIIFALILLALWWRRLFRRHSLASQVYGRICLLAQSAGIAMRPAQTPYEYADSLAITALPRDHEIKDLERLTDIYVRERWADPQSNEHPTKSGEIAELPSIWKRLQPSLFFYVVRHPYFLRWVPQKVADFAIRFWQRRKARKRFNEEL